MSGGQRGWMVRSRRGRRPAAGSGGESRSSRSSSQLHEGGPRFRARQYGRSPLARGGGRWHADRVRQGGQGAGGHYGRRGTVCAVVLVRTPAGEASRASSHGSTTIDAAGATAVTPSP